MNQLKRILPGLFMSVGVALIANAIEGMLPIHLIGGAVIAMFLGMLINHFARPPPPSSRALPSPPKRC